MAKAKRSRVKKRLVLDVGTSAVRLCELSHTKTGYQLTKYYHREFSIDPSMDEEEQRKQRADTLRELLKDAKVRPKKTVLGVPGQSVFTRTRALPPVPEYKVTQIVRYEIQQQIPFSLDQIAFDYQVLQRTEAGGYDVLMAAIKVDVVEKRLDIIRDVKRQIETVDVCPLAAYNWLKYTGEFGEDGDCVALIDLGAATTDIVIERDNQFRFTRSLNLGGNDISSAVAAEFGVSFAEAEKMKRERGFAPSGDPQRDGKGGEVIGRVLSRLVSEISRSFAYFRSQPGGGPVSRIIVTGGGACLRNMIPYLQRQLGIEVRIAQPLAGLAIAPGAQEVNEHPEQAAVALGLALRCCERVAIGVNLIPPRILESARRKEQAVYWGLSLLTLALIVASIIPSLAQKNKMVVDQIDLEKTAVSRYDPRLLTDPGPPGTWKSPYEAQLAEAQDEIKRYQGVVKQLDSVYADIKPWLGYMAAINDARPKGKLVLLSSLETTLLTRAPDYGPAAGLPDPSLRGLGSDDDETDQQPVGRTSFAPPPLKYDSTGFRGISPGFVGGGADAGGGHGRPMSSVPQGQPRNDLANQPANYNGFTIQGFADSFETIQQYVANLKERSEFLNGEGVFYDDRFTNPVDPTALDDAMAYGRSIGSGSTVSMGSMGSRQHGRDRGEDDRPGGLGGMRLGNLNMSSSRLPGPGNRSAESLWTLPGSIYTFRIDLQFKGEPADKQAPPNAATVRRRP